MPTEGASTIKDLDPANPTRQSPAGEMADHLRMLKDVLQASFPELDGLIRNDNATGAAGDTNPPDAETFSQLFSNARDARAAAVPIGGIVLWAGTEAEVPEGWFLCNGTNNTPDLRDRFVVGSDDNNSVYKTGVSGGTSWDTTGAFPLLKTSESPDPNQAVTAGGTINTPVRDHGHWLLPPFYALAYIQYQGI